MYYSNHNGKLIKAETIDLSNANSAFRYGYSLIETMLCRNGEITLVEKHWKRLSEGLKLLNFTISKHFTEAALREEITTCVKKNGLEKLCRVRLQVYTDINSVFEQQNLQPGFLIECFPLNDAITSLNENGLICGIAKGIVKTADAYSHLKSGNMMPYILAANQAKAHSWNDALISNHKENIIESSIANLFWVKDEVVYTPPVNEGCISGIMREHLLEIALDNEISIQEKALTIDTLRNADEVFLTNAVRGIKWIKQVEQQNYGNDFTKNILYPLLKIVF